MNTFADAMGLLQDIVNASDSNNGESLMNCIESARDFIEYNRTNPLLGGEGFKNKESES